MSQPRTPRPIPTAAAGGMNRHDRCNPARRPPTPPSAPTRYFLPHRATGTDPELKTRDEDRNQAHPHLAVATQDTNAQEARRPAKKPSATSQATLTGLKTGRKSASKTTTWRSSMEGWKEKSKRDAGLSPVGTISVATRDVLAPFGYKPGPPLIGMKRRAAAKCPQPGYQHSRWRIRDNATRFPSRKESPTASPDAGDPMLAVARSVARAITA